MKKLSFLLITALVFAWGASSAQCAINVNNTTTGVTPSDTNDHITQGVAYSQTLWVYVPATYLTYTVDSVHVSSVTGQPSGINVSYNPADNGGLTVKGGSGGSICFSGTTNAAVANYPLTFAGSIYVNGSPAALPLSLLASSFTYTFYVDAAPAPSQTCDSVINVNLNTDVPEIFTWGGGSVGFVSGNGGLQYSQTVFLPITSIAEKLTGGIGDSVTAAFVEFGYANIKSTDSAQLVKFYVQNANGPLLSGATTGGPGTAIDSATISLKNIAKAITTHNFAIVQFLSGAKLTTSSFYITVALPQITGDTIVVVTDNGQTTNGQGYLEIGTPQGSGWFSYNGIMGGSNDSLGNYIGASVCGTSPIAPQAAFTTSTVFTCIGTTVSFTDASVGTVDSYSWNFGDGSAVVTTQNATHTFTAAGEYTVVETATNAGGSSLHSADIYVNATPTATDATVNATSSSATNGSAVVTAAGAGPPFTYAWTGSSSTNDSLNGVAAGTYTVLITDTNGCSIVDTIVISFTNGINTLAADVQVKIYPNPANNVLNFVWNVNSVAEINIYDITGALVRTYEVNGTAVNRFNIQDLASGSYVIRITDLQNNGQRSTLFNKF